MKAWLKDKSYRFLVLLDALDEVPTHFSDEIRAAIKSLLNYPHRFVISCRIADYDESLHELAPPFDLVGLQPEEISDYLNQTLGEKGVTLFREQLASNEGMLKLASNALFLNVMSDIVKKDTNVRLPDNPGQLLRTFAEIMPQRRRREGLSANLAPDIVVTALSKLATEMLDRNARAPQLGEVCGWDVPCGTNEIDKVLSEAKKWRFLNSDGSSGDPVEFIHPLFGDYFAAAHLNAQLKAPQPNLDTVIAERFNTSDWHRPIVMLAGICSQPVTIVSWLAKRVQGSACQKFRLGIRKNDHYMWFFLGGPSVVELLMRCWEMSRARDDVAARKAVLDALGNLLNFRWCTLDDGNLCATPELIAAIAALEKLGDPRLSVILTSLVDPSMCWDHPWCAMPLPLCGSAGDL